MAPSSTGDDKSNSNFNSIVHGYNYGHNFAFPRRNAPELCKTASPKQGRRECRAPDAPASRACNDSDRTHTR